MKCNSCWNEIEPRIQAIAATCGHLLCLKCAQAIIESEGVCPICESLIAKNTVKLVTILQETASCRLHLCGQTPETALNSALASVNFYLKQQALHFEMREEQFKQKMKAMQEQCKQKLVEVHNAYKNAKRKYEEMLEQKQMLEKDTQELQEKYSEKAMQTRKLQEMLKKAKSENEMLRTSTGSRNTKQSANGAFSSSFPQPQTHLFKSTGQLRNHDHHHRSHSENKMDFQRETSPGFEIEDFNIHQEFRASSQKHQTKSIKRNSRAASAASLSNQKPFTNSRSSNPFKEFLQNTDMNSHPTTKQQFISALGSPNQMASL